MCFCDLKASSMDFELAAKKWSGSETSLWSSEACLFEITELVAGSSWELVNLLDITRGPGASAGEKEIMSEWEETEKKNEIVF